MPDYPMTRFAIKRAMALVVVLFFAGCVTDSSQVKSAASLSGTAPLGEGLALEGPAPQPQTSVSPCEADDRIETGSIIQSETPSSFYPSGTISEQPMPVETGSEPLFTPLPKTKKSAQGLLDSALEFCNTGNDFWERGDLDNAVGALDEAYSLLLQIDTQHQSPEILQQMDDIRYTISQRVLQVYSSRFTAVNGLHKAIPLDMNAEVQKALDMFKGSLRDFFLSAYCRSGKYRPAIVEALKEAGLPEELSWLPLIESGFKVRAMSKARALGMWQFIASTGYKYGLKRGLWVDERMDPEKSTEAAIAYMKELHQIFGDWQTVLAAYNCGEWGVLRVINTQKINYLDHFWDLYKKLPQETAFYVPQFLAVLHIINDPKKHGFTLPEVAKPMETDVVTMERQVSLKAVSQQMGVTEEELQELNPALRQGVTPPRPYGLKVPLGKGPVLLAEADNIPDWEPPAPAARVVLPAGANAGGACVVHKVQKGESLSIIARKYGTTVGAITAQNGLKSKSRIMAGSTLRIPTARVAYAPSAPEKPGPPAPAKQPSIQGRKPVRTKYVVQKGDSLYKIANQFNVTTQDIQSLNGLRNANLSIGQELVISGPPVQLAEAKTRQYKVVKGDTPQAIAEKYQMELVDLLRMNRLTPRSTIYPGQVLMVQNR